MKDMNCVMLNVIYGVGIVTPVTSVNRPTLVTVS